MQHLALAWLCTFEHTSTVILGASKPEQVLDNLKALEVLPKLTPAVLEKVEAIIGSKPAPVVSPPVHVHGVVCADVKWRVELVRAVPAAGAFAPDLGSRREEKCWRNKCIISCTLWDGMIPLA